VRRTDTSAWPCNIARSAAILGDHWNILLIRQACLGFRRYEDFQRTLGIGRNMLTIRLNGLVDHGILERVEYQAKPPRSEYRLTDMGRGPRERRCCSTTRHATVTCTRWSSAVNALDPSTFAR
jgi:DNA-binding HxlR family transcriptional regulator